MRLRFPRILTGVDFLRRFFPYANCTGHGSDIETARARNERETSAQRISVSPSLVYLWRERSTYVQAIGDTATAVANFCSIKPMLKSSDILAQSQLHVFLLAGSQNCSIIFVGFSIGFMLEKTWLLMPKIPIQR